MLTDIKNNNLKKVLQENILFIALATTVIATLGSLYFSEIRHYPPCVLCWYQRICLYPLLVILLAGIIQRNKKIHWYALPLSVAGLGISLYHNLLYYKIIPEAIAPCISGVSCTTKFIEYFGFITIPLLSFAAFALITVCMVSHSMVMKQNSGE